MYICEVNTTITFKTLTMNVITLEYHGGFLQTIYLGDYGPGKPCPEKHYHASSVDEINALDGVKTKERLNLAKMATAFHHISAFPQVPLTFNMVYLTEFPDGWRYTSNPETASTDARHIGFAKVPLSGRNQ